LIPMPSRVVFDTVPMASHCGDFAETFNAGELRFGSPDKWAIIP
jgi:hypothetical protein